MTDTARHLAASRTAHTAGKAALARGDRVGARGFFEVALRERLAARDLDPAHTDPAWLEDALHPPMPGEKQRRYMRLPGLTVKEVAARQDAELEVYFLEKIDPSPEGVKLENPEILTPKQWAVVTPGAVDEHQRLLCGGRHVWQLLAVDRRVCPTCQQIEELRETKSREDTDAYRQLQRERL